MTARVTIWQALAARLKRQPTHEEACAEVRRILVEALEANARAKAEDAARR